MYLEDIAFAMVAGFLVTLLAQFYIIVEINVIKTVIDDFIWFGWGGAQNDATVADD